MPDFISQEQHHAEVAALSHEIYRLSKQIEETERERAEKLVIDPHDPFDNPTEYHSYSGDYTEILPQITIPEYRIDLNPCYEERKRIKRYYAAGGWCALLQFILSIFAGSAAIRLVMQILLKMYSGVDSESIYTYIKASSILIGLNMLIYIISNVGIGFLGIKISKTRFSSLVKTHGFGFGSAVQYCFIALFIWTSSAFISIALGNVFDKFGFSVDVSDTSGMGVTALGTAVSIIYHCVIAPVTEEFFFRGALLKLFSKSNQRFAVFTTAVFFGLAHGNLRQFVLAFFTGIFLAHITLKHGSIIPSIIVHMFVNTFSTSISMLDLTVNEQTVLWLSVYVAAAVGALMLLMFRVHDRVPQTTPAQVQRGGVIARGTISVVLAFTVQVFYGIYLVYVNSR
jgi:abortive infection protein